jgi:hypothetical protein
MDPIHDTGSNFGTTEIANLSGGEPHDNRLVRLRDRPWYKTMTRRMATVIAALALMALPVGIGLSSKKYIFAKIPFLKQLGLRLPASESAVLAVDVNGLAIQSASAATAEFENAVMAQLANLHRTYASWAASNEDLIGSLTIKLRVDKAGNVADIDPMAARLSNAAFTSVVLGEIRRWTFPHGGKEPVEITIPLLFVPKGMDAGTVVQWERKTRSANRDAAPPAPLRLASLAPMAMASDNVSTSLSQSSGEVQRETSRQASFDTAKNPMNPKPVSPIFKTTQTVGLREQPRFSAKRVHDVDAETELNVLENKGDWLKVKVADAGSVGFIRKEFLTPIH